MSHKRFTLEELRVNLLERPKAPVVEQVPWAGHMRAGDEFNRVHRIDEVLILLGFHSPRVDHEGSHWVRPGKEPGEGASATVYHDAPDKVTVWSGTCQAHWPALEVNKPYDAFGLLVATEYDGDFSRAASALYEEGFGDDNEEARSYLDDLQKYLATVAEKMTASPPTTDNGWNAINLGDPRYASPPPPPDLLQRSDEMYLLYRGRIHYAIGAPECLAADTFIKYVVRTPGGRIQSRKGGTIERLYQRFHGLPGRGRGNHTQRPETIGSEFWVQSINEAGNVFLNKIENVVDAGVKEVYELETRGGHVLRLTADHKLWVGDGFLPLSKLDVGDKVFVNPGRPQYVGGRQPKPHRDEILVKYHPFGPIKVVNGCTYHRLDFAYVVYEAARNGMTFEGYRKYLNTAPHRDIDCLWAVQPGYVIHHRDLNPFNNVLSNLELLSDSAHRQLHIEETKSHIQIKVQPDVIWSINKIGLEQCYDIQCADPYNNFVAEGIVVHNSGKSWLSQVAMAWEMMKGNNVIAIDFENDPHSIRERLHRNLGVSLDVLTRQMAYFNPSGVYTEKQWESFRSLLGKADLVVVDGVSNGMNLFGQSPLNHDDVVSFEMGFLRPLTYGGAAVIAIDHVAKNSESGNVSAFGGQHKKAAVTGAMFEIRAIKKFGRGMTGRARGYLLKDKPGYLRQFVEMDPSGDAIFDLVIESLLDGTLKVSLTPPSVEAPRPTFIMDQISRYLERNDNVSSQDVRNRATSSTAVKAVSRAIETLLEEGYISKTTDGRFNSVKRFRKDDPIPSEGFQPFVNSVSLPSPPPLPVTTQLEFETDELGLVDSWDVPGLEDETLT